MMHCIGIIGQIIFFYTNKKLFGIADLVTALAIEYGFSAIGTAY